MTFDFDSCFRGACVECRDKDEDTPLLIAASKNHLETFKYLIQHGANVLAKDINDGTALFRASSEGCLEIVKVGTYKKHLKMIRYNAVLS